MSLSTTIPRFLLPRGSAVRHPRLALSQSSSLPLVRHASKFGKKPQPPPKSSKPLVLEKPTKFNPPSHGSRLRRPTPRYGAPLTAEEKSIQAKKKYPTMMAPEGTFMHWFMHNRSIHTWITLGTLFVLAATVFITNFKRDSPYADMLPHFTQLFIHPIAYSRTVLEVMKLHSAHVTAETQERRAHKAEDVAKRAAYRKAHGMDRDQGFGGWTAKTGVGEEGDKEQEVQVRQKHFSGKRWLGIW